MDIFSVNEAYNGGVESWILLFQTWNILLQDKSSILYGF